MWTIGVLIGAVLGFILGWVACSWCCNAACADCKDALRYLHDLGEQ